MGEVGDQHLLSMRAQFVEVNARRHLGPPALAVACAVFPLGAGLGAYNTCKLPVSTTFKTGKTMIPLELVPEEESILSTLIKRKVD